LPPPAWEWINIDLVLWEAPEWFTYCQALKSLSEYTKLQSFFVNTLQLSNVDLDDCLLYLSDIQDEGNEQDCGKVTLIYGLIKELSEAHGDADVAHKRIK
jgi:hypothetical protein